MRVTHSRRRIAGLGALLVVVSVCGWFGFRHVERGLRASKLIDAVYSGDRGAVQRLLDQGADPNAGNLSGFKPLMRAVTVPPQQVKAELVQLLLWYGADPNIRDEHGKTVLDISLSNQLPNNVIEALENNGARRAVDLPQH